MNVMIIPAAGRGSRLQYDGPKLLYELDGKPLLGYLIERYTPFVNQFIVVIHPDFEAAVTEYLDQLDINCIIDFQYKMTGMLDAIIAPMNKLDPTEVQQVWITWCDQIAISEQTALTMKQLLNEGEPPYMVLPTIKKRQPYIHMQRDDQNNIIKVLQQREGDTMPEVGENDCGLFGLSGDAYFSLLNEFSNIHQEAGGTTQERNFLPFITWLNGKAKVQTFTVENEVESIGVNAVEDAEKILQMWKNN